MLSADVLRCSLHVERRAAVASDRNLAGDSCCGGIRGSVRGGGRISGGAATAFAAGHRAANSRPLAVDSGNRVHFDAGAWPWYKLNPLKEF